MSDKKTIQEALSEVQKNVDSQRIDEANPFGIFGRAGKVASKGGKAAPIRPMPHGGEDLVGKAKAPKAAETIDVKAQPKTSTPSVPEAPKTGSGLGKAALRAGVGAAAGYGAYKAYDTFSKDKGPVGPDPSKFTPDTPKQPEAPKAPEKTAETPKMTFNQAYAKARELAKSAGKNPNVAQFKFDRGAGEKVYQAAATKKDYVPMSKQFKVDIGTPKAAETPKQPEAPKTETPKAPETPKLTPPKEDTGVAARRDIRQGSQDVLGSALDVVAGKSGAGERFTSGASQFASGMGQAASHAKNVIQGAAGAASERLGKNAQPEYESGKKKKMSEENINELSPFERTFAQKMKQLGPGKTYRDPTTGKDILLKYAQNKPSTSTTPKPSTPQGAPGLVGPGGMPKTGGGVAMPKGQWADPGKLDYSKSNTPTMTKPMSSISPAPSTSKPMSGISPAPSSEPKFQTQTFTRSTSDGVSRPTDAPGKVTNVPMDTSRPSMLSPTPIAQQRPESESGGKKKKMSEDTNPLIASFLALQEKNPSNMFEAAKKLSKKQDEKLDVVDDDKIDAKDLAALRAGKKHVDEAVLKDPKDPSVQGSGDVTMSAPKPAAPAAAPVHVKPTNPEKLKNLKDPRDPSVQGSGDVTYKEEVTFSQAEIDHINSFFLEASVAPTRPEVATGADSTSDKMSQNDVTGTSTESGKRIRKEEIELEEGFAKIVKGIKRSLKGWPAEPLHGSGGNKPKDVVKRTRERSDSDVKSLASDSNKAAEHSPAGLQKNVAKQEMKRRNLEEGRPKKNPTPETTERDPRQHIQVIAGRAAAGNTLDFPHNDGTKSKITPGMGRKITAHLNGLKPADRQAAVNKMHASAEGLKV